MGVAPDVLFSRRTDFGEGTDPLMAAAAERRVRGLPLLDLTDSNPTRCGLRLDPQTVLAPLSSQANLGYQGEPFGPWTARAAVADTYYTPRGAALNAERILLTANTSEAYSYLFRLLCGPGDHVLVPQPSYPLFDLLAQISDVDLQRYPLRFHDRWQIDLGALEEAITERTRAILVVHPNNPTGQYVSAAERAALRAIAARHGLALIVDEVFLDYVADPSGPECRSFAAEDAGEALTFVMSGLSKVLALPQMKIAWTTVLGLDRLRSEALSRLEFIADTFLSVAGPGANALPAWLAATDVLQDNVRGRLRTNLDTADRLLAAWPLVRRLPVEAGWSMLLRVPAWHRDTDFAIRMLDTAGVLVHPGSFFGLPARGYVVVSLLLDTVRFEQGMVAVCRAVTDEAIALEQPPAPGK